MTAHPSPAHEAAGGGKLLVRNWRVAPLTGLGIPGALAEVNAGLLDWHQAARLVQRGCPRGWPRASPADERTRELARRRLPPRRPRTLPGSTRKGLYPRWHAFVRQYNDPMQLVLLAAGIGSRYPLKQLGTGILLILLTLFNAVEGLHQEGKATAAVSALQKMVIITARVRRDGQLAEIADGPADRGRSW